MRVGPHEVFSVPNVVIFKSISDRTSCTCRKLSEVVLSWMVSGLVAAAAQLSLFPPFRERRHESVPRLDRVGDFWRETLWLVSACPLLCTVG